MLLLLLLMVALTMPLSSVQVPPLSVTVTGALTLVLATLGKASAAPSAAAPNGNTTDNARKAEACRPRGPRLPAPPLELAMTVSITDG